MYRVLAVLLLMCAVDGTAEEKPLVPMDLVKASTRLLSRKRREQPVQTNVHLRVRGIRLRGEVVGEFAIEDKIEVRDGAFHLRFAPGPNTTTTIDLDSGVPIRTIGPASWNEAVSLSPSHYLLTIVGESIDLSWELDVRDQPDMALFVDGDDAVVMIVAHDMTDLKLRFDDPSARVLRNFRSGDLVTVSVKLPHATGRVIASGRISGTDWSESRRVGDNVCVLR